MIKQYRKKPVCIEAVQFTRNNWDEIVSFTNNTAHTLMTEKCIDGIATCIIPTLEGQHIATEKDFIIKGVHGEFYPCKPDIFEKTYSLIKDQENFERAQRLGEYLENQGWSIFGAQNNIVKCKCGTRVETKYCPECGKKIIYLTEKPILDQMEAAIKYALGEE